MPICIKCPGPRYLKPINHKQLVYLCHVSFITDGPVFCYLSFSLNFVVIVGEKEAIGPIGGQGARVAEEIDKQEHIDRREE